MFSLKSGTLNNIKGHLDRCMHKDKRKGKGNENVNENERKRMREKVESSCNTISNLWIITHEETSKG